jgi:predicted ABC-type ATPase
MASGSEPEASTMSDSKRPVVVVIGGPNGAGKTTSAQLLLPEGLAIRQFVNADTIAAGLSAFDPESVAREAGRIMLRRLRELADQRESFAFESTLASRSFATFLRELKATGYSVRVAYIWLRSPDLSVERVAGRVRRGGHFVPEETVRRRYVRGRANFLELYRPLADSWIVCDNSDTGPMPIAVGTHQETTWVLVPEAFDAFMRG